MHVLLTFLLFTAFETNIENAFTFLKTNDWIAAAAALDEAATVDPDLFAVNNLPYLRGRIAENQQDWRRALEEFESIGSNNPLRPLAAWHSAQAAIRIGDATQARTFMAELPADFPAEMKLQVALQAPPELAVSIYERLPGRNARLQYALARNDHLSLWALMRERNADDVGLQAARALSARSLSEKDSFDIAEAFLAHRQFTDAIHFYEVASEDTDIRPRALYQIARAHFLSEDYRVALDDFRAIAAEFASTEWQKDSEYQIASCFWRLGEYENAAKAYSDYIAQYGGVAQNEGAVRNLVDVYRLLGDNVKARSLLDKALAVQLTAATRQSLLFAKAKILFIQKQYAAALQIFQQLGRTRLRSTAGGSTKTEVRYYEALTNSKLGRASAANLIWKQLAADRFTYYGQKSAVRLGQTSTISETASRVCDASEDATRSRAEQNMDALRRPVRTEALPATDALPELLFLKLWDEASIWMDRQARPNPRTAAELGYLSGRYYRAISYAGRMPQNDAYTIELKYPAGFRSLICKNAATYSVDPLWLHSIIWQESKYNPSARSDASARGLMQFIPDTAADVASAIGKTDFSLESLYDPSVNIELGARYWATLMSEFKEPELALAAYNGGPDNVRRWKGKWKDGDAEFFVSDIGFVETKNYVMSVFGARAAYGSR